MLEAQRPHLPGSPPVILTGDPQHLILISVPLCSPFPSPHPCPSRWTFDCTQKRLLGDHISPSFPGWRSTERGCPLRLSGSPAPPRPRLCRPWGLVTAGSPAQSWHPRMPVLQDRDHTLVHSGDDKKTPHREGALCFIQLPLLSHVPTSDSGTTPVALSSHPPLPHTSYSAGDAPVCPGSRAVLRCLRWARPPHLPSDGHPAPSVVPHHVPTQPRWSLNCHVPVQHRPALPSGPKPGTGPGPRDLPPDTHTASSLIPVSPP